MISFGDRFPASFKKSKLQVGAVIYTHCPFTTPPKNKYMLICSLNPLLVLLINSKINAFIENKPALKNCQILLSQKEHLFLE